MREPKYELSKLFKWCLVCAGLLVQQWAVALDMGDAARHDIGTGYVARQDNLRSFFGAISAQIKMPIIVSKMAAGKQVSGDFDLTANNIVDVVARQLGLIAYSDGRTIYIYDAGETKSRIISMKNVSFEALTGFLNGAGLADPAYPLRGDGRGTFYIAGPPIYVDLVAQAATFMDSQGSGLHQQNSDALKVEVIKLNNTFVSDRSYARRDDNIVIPGIASVIEQLLEDKVDIVGPERVRVAAQKEATGNENLPPPLIDPHMSLTDAEAEAEGGSDRTAPATHSPEKVRVIAYPETNSLLVRGTSGQVDIVRDLVRTLDEEKRHVELALWIIDLQKDDLDNLGVQWQGGGSFSLSGGRLGVDINPGSSLNAFSTLEGAHFIASVMALSRDNRAQIVSRPVVLTQENTPALFDNNQTFYTKLLAERAVQLEHVTYGTMIHVLPRITAKNEIELSLDIEDGAAAPQGNAPANNALPTVSRTKISTVARVPRGKSLLVGGYSRGENGDEVSKIPLLGDLPWIGGAFRYHKKRRTNTVRVFLIRPRAIAESIDIDVQQQAEDAKLQALVKGIGVSHPASESDVQTQEIYSGH